MAQYRNDDDERAVSSVFAVNETPDGVSAFEIHRTAYTSKRNVPGETVIIVAKIPETLR